MRSDPGAAYDAVAAFYDRWWGLEFAEETRNLIAGHLCRWLPDRAKVLDLCCGTGLFLRELGELGHEAFGVDESALMLKRAQKNAPGAHLQRADMAEFRWETRFDSVVSLYNSVNHVRSEAHLRATFANVAVHTRQGGLFLFDYVPRESFEAEWECQDDVDGNEASQPVRYAYDRVRRQATCVVGEQGIIRQIPFEPADIHAALSGASFILVEDSAMAALAPPAGRRLVLATNGQVY